MEKIKVINNANKVIEVTVSAWEIPYKDRKGFSLYEEKKESTIKTTRKSPPKRMKQDD